MIETRVRIVSARAGTAWVEATESSGCGACRSKSSCGVSGLGRFFSNKRQPVAVACGDSLKPGQELVLAVDESEMLRAGLLAYLLPALLAVFGAALADHVWGGDATGVLGALAGFALGLAIARLFSRAPKLCARPSNSKSPILLSQGETP
jgi:sigma-E factor negative regulatory protein RseC